MTESQLREAGSHRNVKAFARVVRQNESSQDDEIAYKMRFPNKTFDDFSKHPDIKEPIPWTPGEFSTAAGAFQITGTTDRGLRRKYPWLPITFAPPDQELRFVCLLDDCGALPYVLAGDFDRAVHECVKGPIIWTSLPGGSENPQELSKARGIYEFYGGTYGTQPAVEIVDKSPIPEKPMGAIALPLLAQLIPQVLGLFSQRAQTTIAEKTGADPKLAAQFMQNLIAQVGTATGITVTNETTATQAVGALTSLPPALRVETVAMLEPKALSTLDDLIRAGDKSIEWDEKRWNAELTGRKQSSEVAVEEHKAGLWDMTWALIGNTEGQTWLILVAVVTGVITSMWLDKDAYFTGLIAIAGGVINQILKNKSQANDYRFDGTKDSSEQTKALNKALDKK